MKSTLLPIPLHSGKLFVCHYCLKQFKSETRYISHECEDMRRELQVKSVIGQSAYSMYNAWLKHYKKAAPNIHTFSKSKYYKTFIGFAEFVHAVKLIDPYHFIAWTVRKEYPINMWQNQVVYGEYLQYLDKQYPPLKSFAVTVDYLFKQSEDLNIDISEVYETITPSEFVDLIYKRRISPWFILNSNKFKQYFIKHFNTEQRVIVEHLINPDFWGKQFSSHPAEIIRIKEMVKELGL